MATTQSARLVQIGWSQPNFNVSRRSPRSDRPRPAARLSAECHAPAPPAVPAFFVRATSSNRPPPVGSRPPGTISEDPTHLAFRRGNQAWMRPELHDVEVRNQPKGNCRGVAS